MLLHFVSPFNFVIMQHDHVLKKLTFDLLTPSTRSELGGGGGGVAVKIFASMLLHFVIPFNLICSLAMFLKKLNLDLVTPRVRQNSSYHCAAFVIPFDL